MTGHRSILLPDEDGHYRREALRLDRESHRIAPAGTHALDGVAHGMAMEETRRRFFSRAAQGIGALALASLAPDGARAADAVGGLPGCRISRRRRSAVFTSIWWALRRRWRRSITNRR